MEEAARRLLPDPADHPQARQAERLVALDMEIARYTAAVGAGGSDLPSLLAALRDRERQRADLRAEHAALEALAELAALDGPGLERSLGTIVAEWRALLLKNTASPRQIVKKLLAGRLVFTPHASGTHVWWSFAGAGRLDPLLSGVIGVPKVLVPPGGRVGDYEVPLRVLLRAALGASRD